MTIAIEKDQIAVFCINARSDLLSLNRFKRILSLEEIRRSNRYRFQIDVNDYIIRQAVLRMLISRLIGCSPREVHFEKKAKGKPYAKLKYLIDLQFNVSISDGFIVYAFSYQDEIGIDIERLKIIPEMTEIVDSHFTKREKFIFYTISKEQRISFFYKIWTRKEAVLKAQGDGLCRSLKSINVVNKDPDRKSVRVKVSDKRKSEIFWVSDVSVEVGFSAAVASRGPFKDILVHRLELSQIE